MKDKRHFPEQEAIPQEWKKFGLKHKAWYYRKIHHITVDKNFKIVLGDEIYLIDDIKDYQEKYNLVLIPFMHKKHRFVRINKACINFWKPSVKKMWNENFSILSGKNTASQFLHCWIALIPIKVSGIIAIIKSVWKAVVKH